MQRKSCHQHFHFPAPPSGWEWRPSYVDPRTTVGSKTQLQVMHSLMPTASSPPSPATITAQQWRRKNSQSGASGCLVRQGFRNQTGVNSHLTLTLTLPERRKHLPRLSTALSPQPPLSWNEGHRGSNWCPASQGCALRTRDTFVPFLLGLPIVGMALPHTHTLAHE